MRKFGALIVTCFNLILCFVCMGNDEISDGRLPVIKSQKRVICSSRNTRDFANKVSFEIDVLEAGEYDLIFWMCPVMFKDGSIATYKVEINGVDSGLFVNPAQQGWQYAFLNDTVACQINQGINIIDIRGDGKMIPNVESVKLLPRAIARNINNVRFTQYFNSIQDEIANNEWKKNVISGGLKMDSVISKSIYSLDEDPMYEYDYIFDVNYNYTFYADFAFKKGENVYIGTKGINNLTHTVYIFSKSNPDVYSWSMRSNGSYITGGNIPITFDDEYRILIRSYISPRAGYCDLNVNNEYFYNRVPVPMSQSYSSAYFTGDEKHIFTSNSTGDPMLIVEENNFPSVGKIVAWNDNGVKEGDFDWRMDAHIRKALGDSMWDHVYNIYVFNSSSENPNGVCDLYMGCCNRDLFFESLYDSFPNLKKADIIRASSETYDNKYNCISWAAGITSFWHWPPDVSSPYYDVDPLTSFDKFFEDAGLTRNNANKENAIVALWGIVNNKGLLEYKHASVTKGDGLAHGYDWESKLGAAERIFHPKYALEDSSYGRILHYYTTPWRSRNLSNVIKKEYIGFDSAEVELIHDFISKIDKDVLSEFSILYTEWENVTYNTIDSNPDDVAACDEFKRVLDFCNKHQECIFCLYEKIANNDFAAIILYSRFKFSSGENKEKLRNIRESARTIGSNDNVVKSPSTCIMNLIKMNLELDYKDNIAKLGERLYNQNENESKYINCRYAVEINTISVEFDVVGVVDSCSIIIQDLEGNSVDTLVRMMNLESGHHKYMSKELKAGYYLVSIISGGIKNSVKIKVG